MKFKMLLSAAAVALVTAMPAGATPTYPTFTVNPGNFSGGSLAPTFPDSAYLGTFVANDIGGQYTEALTFTGPNTFSVSLGFIAGQFNLDQSPGSNVSYTALQTGLGITYGLLGTLVGSGTYSVGTGGAASFNLTSGTLQLLLDTGTDAVNGVSLTSGGAPVTFTSGGSTTTDTLTLLGSSTTVVGNGTQSCTGGNNCGSFGQTASQFALNSDGSSFFTAPNPFFSIALTSGQFEGVPVANGTTVIAQGTANTVFNNVPEPSGLALVGLGLVALGYARRSSSKKA